MKIRRIRWLFALLMNVLMAHAQAGDINLADNGDGTWSPNVEPEGNVTMSVEYEDILDFTDRGDGTWVLAAMPDYDVKLEVECEDDLESVVDLIYNDDGTWIPERELGVNVKMYIEYEDILDFTDRGDGTWVLAAMPDYNVKLVVEYMDEATDISLADNANNATTLNTYNGKTVNVTLEGRTLYKDGKWNTLCLPFGVDNIDNSPLSGATVKELDVTGKNGLDAGTGTLYLSFKTATQIEAGKPYLVKWESGTDIVKPVFADVTITSTAPTAVVSATSGLEEVTMTGNYSPVSVAANDQSIMFMGGDNTLYYTTTDRTLRCFRAHFGIESQNKVNSFVMNFGDDVATGVSLVQSQESADDCYYDLQGRKLSGKPTKAGIYINQGRKISVK